MNHYNEIIQRTDDLLTVYGQGHRKITAVHC